MKQGKRPTRAQKMAMKSVGLNCDNWLVSKNLSDELHLVHRYLDRIKIIPIERR